MKCSKRMIFLFLVSLLGLCIYAGCGNNVNEGTVFSSVIIADTPVTEKDQLIIDSDDSYYIVLEKKLNDELDVNRAPDKCAAQGLTKVVLNFATDEIQTCATYDLSKITTTAYFSDKTAEIVTPIWSIYSGGGTLDGTIYTATNKPAIIVFKALYTENGISKLALFRLTVTGLISIALNKTTDEIQLPATYDLSAELLVTAKISNGTTKAIVKGDQNLKWTLSSGAGTLTDGVYTPSAKVETAVFNISYSENGVTKTAQFKLKVTGLSSLILSKATDEVNSCETYDLASKIVVSNKLSNGTINDITASPNLTWVLSSGTGILEGKIYTAPAKAETAVFTASYTEAGITKTAQFRLKVIGLSSVVLDKATDEIMLPATYDLASEVNAVAKFSDGDSKSVDLIWALSSGAGTLSGTVYTPAPKPETAVFTGSYTENGMTKTAQFRLKVIGLSSLTLSKTTDEVVSCATYDLSQIVVNDKLSNGTINNITSSTTWKLISGFGTLSGTAYTAPARGETAAFTANYTEAGITKTAQFRLKVIALASIRLSKTTDEAQILAPYDLAVNFSVTAKLSNGRTKPVAGNDPNLKWTLSYGSGILSGTIYTPPERIETAVLIATYKENGIAQSAQLRLKSTATLRGKIELVGLTLAQTTDSVRINEMYDLSKLIAVAKFTDQTTAEVSLSWIVSSGGGSIVGTTYTAPNNAMTDKLTGTYVATDGSVRSVNFTVKVIVVDPNIIDTVTATVTPAGAILTLKNGIMMEIPANSAISTVSVTLTNYRDPEYYTLNQSAIGIYSTADLLRAIIKIPINNQTEMEATGILLEGESIKLLPLTGLVDDSNKTYNIDIISQSAYNSPTILRSATEDRIDLKNAMIMAEKRDKKTYLERVTLLGDKKGIPIRMPYYFQYLDGTCWATAALMFIKGHKNLPAEQYSTIYKLSNDMGIPKSSSYLIDYKGIQLLGNYGLIRTAGVQRNGNRNLEDEISSAIDNTPIEKKTWFTNKSCLDYIFGKILDGKPVILFTKIHLLLIVGFDNIDENDFLKSTVIVNNPSNEFPNTICSFEQILHAYNKDFSNPFSLSNYIAPLVTYAAENAKPQSNLQTIHFHDEYTYDVEQIQSNGTTIIQKVKKLSGIRFLKGDQEVSKITWDHLNSDGYKTDPETEFRQFDFIEIECDCYNTDMQSVVCKAKTELYYFLDNGNKSQSPIFTNSKPIYLPLSTPMLSSYNACQRYNETISYVNAIKSNIPVGVSNFVLEIGLYDSNGAKKLDGFNIKFKCSIISKDLKIAPTSAELKMKQQLQFTALLNEATIETGILWSTESAGGTINSTGSYTAPVKPGTYLVTAKYEDVEATAEVRVIPSDFKIAPKQTTLIYGQQQEFSATVDNLAIDSNLAWSVEDANSGSINSTTGQYVAPNVAGMYIVKALYYGELEATAEVTVQAPVLQINPPTITLYTQETQNFTLLVNNTTQEAEIQWTSTGGGIGSSDGSYMAPDHAGTYIVTATFRTVEATAEVIVKEHEIKLTPPSAEMNIGQQVQFTAFVDNATAETGVSWSTDVMGGTVTQTGLYTAPSLPGIHRVTAKYQGAETSAEVTVNSLFLTPLTYQLRTDQTVQFDLKYGVSEDTTNEVTTQALWKVVPEVGSVSGGLYTPAAVGNYKVTAEYAGMVLTAEVTVTAADLKITPPSAVLNRSQQMTFKALVGDTTQETGISWSVVSPSGGSITTAGVYTAPAQWGKYVIKAAYQGIEATAEVKVNDERIRLQTTDTYMLDANALPMKADGSPLYESSGRSFSIEVYGGIDVSTLELSLVEGNDKGRLVYSSKSGTTGYSPIRYYYYYYAPNSTKPYYDTNEIVHISAKCPENSSTVAQRTVILLRPLLSDTIEINDSANGRKWQFKSLGYRTQNNTWSNYGYKTGSYMIHGTYLGIFNGATSPSYIQQYYCGEADGAHKTYLYMPGDERNGKLAALNVFSNFINYKHERWEYTWENRTDPKTGYISGPYKITNKVTENYQRANINVGWGATSPNVYEKFDGWVTP